MPGGAEGLEEGEGAGARTDERRSRAGEHRGPLDPTVLLVNAQARTGEDAFAAARAALGNRGVALQRAECFDDARVLRQEVTRSLERGARTVVVGGGDGTLSLAADALLGTDAVLGALPLGTGNDFCRALGIPADLEQAAEIVAYGRLRWIDVGLTADGHCFLNAASVGLTSGLARLMDPALKRRLGALAYPVTAARDLTEVVQPFSLTLETADERRTLNAYQLVVGNGRFHGGGRMVSPEATLDDTLLDVYAIEASVREGEPPPLADLMRLARIGLLLRRGRHLQHPSVQHLRVRALRVITRPPLELDLDGELKGRTPTAFSVAPRALRVLAPTRT